MPELPEVEIIRRSLEKHLLGRQVLNTEVRLPRQIKWPEPDVFTAMVTGRHIVRLGRSGKYLLLFLDNGNELVFHLRMTGRLCYTEDAALSDAYARIVFHLDGGGWLVYGDPRTLGAVYALKPGEEQRVQGLAEMGPEPLTEAFSVDYLQSVLANRRTKIKSFLLNQHYIGGIGNIYADEALFLARLHPLRLAASLSREEIVRLQAAVNEVIRAGIEDGGTTFRDYRNGEGGKGSHQEKLHVYARKGEPCHSCGTPIEKITVGGRGTHFCPTCQTI